MAVAVEVGMVELLHVRLHDLRGPPLSVLRCLPVRPGRLDLRGRANGSGCASWSSRAAVGRSAEATTRRRSSRLRPNRSTSCLPASRTSSPAITIPPRFDAAHRAGAEHADLGLHARRTRRHGDRRARHEDHAAQPPVGDQSLRRLHDGDLRACGPSSSSPKHGWVGPDVWYAHLVHADASEIALLAETGTGMAHCPQSNCRLGSGIAPADALDRLGGRVSLGVDGAASNEAADMVSEMHCAWLAHRSTKGAASVRCEDILRWATAGGRGCAEPARDRHAGGRTGRRSRRSSTSPILAMPACTIH